PHRVNLRNVEIKELPLPEPAFQPLFNGKDFDGWLGDPASWRSLDGNLECRGSKASKGPLWTKKKFENYTLQLEFRLPQENAPGAPVVFSPTGLILNTDWTDGEATGIAIDLGLAKGDQPLPVSLLRGARGAVSTKPIFLHARPLWNHLLITCKDGNATIQVNGKVAATVNGCTPRGGYISLRDGGTPIIFRKIEIMELLPRPPQPAFQPLFNGKDLTGWEGDVQRWKVQDGMLAGRGGVLRTSKIYRNYELSLQYRFAPPKDDDSFEGAVQLHIGDDPTGHLEVILMQVAHPV